MAYLSIQPFCRVTDSEVVLPPHARCLFCTRIVVDLLGYVVVKNALSAEQVRIGNEAIDMLEKQGDLTVCSNFLPSLGLVTQAPLNDPHAPDPLVRAAIAVLRRRLAGTQGEIAVYTAGQQCASAWPTAAVLSAVPRHAGSPIDYTAPQYHFGRRLAA